MGKAKFRKRANAAKACNAKPAAKLKLIADFSDEFQQLSGSGTSLQTSKLGLAKQNQLLHLITALDHARACKQHSQCQSLCADIRAFLASNLEEKIVCRLAALLSSVCPLLTSSVAATRQAASVVIRTLTVKVRVEVLVPHAECLAQHLRSAVASGDAVALNGLDLLQMLLVSAPRLVLHYQDQLLPHCLALLIPQTKKRRINLMKKLERLSRKAPVLGDCSGDEGQLYARWLSELNTCTSSSTQEGVPALPLRASFLAFLAGLVQQHLRWPDEDLLGANRIGTSTLWLQATAVVAGGAGTEELLRGCNLEDEAPQKLVWSQLRLVEVLRCALSSRVSQEWLAAYVEASLLQLHRRLLPPPPASPASIRSHTTTRPLLELRLNLLVVACHCCLYRPSTLHLLTQALGDILVQLVNTPDTTAEMASVYQLLLLNTFLWLQDDGFQHSGQLVEKFDLSEWRSQRSKLRDGMVNKLSPLEAARADQLLADALEDPKARTGSAWSKRILTEADLLEKLLLYDVKRLIPPKYKELIDPAVAGALADMHEKKDRRARSLENWNTERQELVNRLLDSLLECKGLPQPHTARHLPLLAPLLAWLQNCNLDTPAGPRRVWWRAVLGELDHTPAGEPNSTPARELFKYRFCSALSSSAAAVEDDDDWDQDGGVQ